MPHDDAEARAERHAGERRAEGLARRLEQAAIEQRGPGGARDRARIDSFRR